MPRFSQHRAARAYTCSACGVGIAAGDPYVREEPHPMARTHRAERARPLCNACSPAEGVTRPRRRRPLPAPGQMRFSFSETIASLPAAMLQALVTLGPRTTEGDLVVGVTIPWFEIIRHLRANPEFLHTVPWRKVEELIAGAYEREGWDTVILTPRSGDGGKDIIAEGPGGLRIRIIDQVKAFGPGNRVTANDVRALLGVLSAEPNVSKGLVTTTAEFAPELADDPALRQFMPTRLELRNGEALRGWLLGLAESNEAPNPALQPAPPSRRG